MDCCKLKIPEVLAAHELYSLNCSLLAKQIIYLCSCSQKNRSARYARECFQIPFVTPYIVCTLPFKCFNYLGQWTPPKIYLTIKLLTLPLANLK